MGQSGTWCAVCHGLLSHQWTVLLWNAHPYVSHSTGWVSVARGVCETNEAGYLTGVVERTAIERIDGDIQFIDENGQKVVLEENVPVSMNMWGFTPDYFVHSEKYFVDFLKENIDKPKSEFFIPLVVNELITKGIATVKVLDTTAKWFGVTYAADRQGVVDKIQALVDAGEYPNKLF